MKNGTTVTIKVPLPKNMDASMNFTTGIRYEDNRWTGLLLLAAVTCTLGFAVPAGYCLGVLNTPSKILQKWCNITLIEERGIVMSQAQLDFAWSLIVSVFLVGGVFGGLIGAWFADYVGRKGTLVAGNILNLNSAFMFFASKSIPSVEMFFVARIISGFTAGLLTTVIPMYLTEISPPKLTGVMGVLFPIGFTLGLLISQILGLDTLLGTETLWPYLVSAYWLISVVVCMALLFLPESPKYLLSVCGEEEKALNQLSVLRNLPKEVVAWEIISSSSLPRRNQEKWNLIRVLRTPQLRNPLYLVIVLQAGQQLSGINAVFYYSTKIFETAGLEKNWIPYANIGTGFINFVVNVCAMGLVKHFGRRPLVILSSSLTSVILILLALSIKFMDCASWIPAMSIIFVMAFVFVFDLGLGPIPCFIGSELVDIGPRPMIMALGSVANYGANFLVAVGYTSIHNMVHEWVFVGFAMSTFLMMMFIIIYLPETKKSITSSDITQEEVLASDV